MKTQEHALTPKDIPGSTCSLLSNSWLAAVRQSETASSSSPFEISSLMASSAAPARDTAVDGPEVVTAYCVDSRHTCHRRRHVPSRVSNIRSVTYTSVEAGLVLPRSRALKVASGTACSRSRLVSDTTCTPSSCTNTARPRHTCMRVIY